MYHWLDRASYLVFRFSCKHLYQWRTNKKSFRLGLRQTHKVAALECGYISYLRLFWEMGMSLRPFDCNYLNPNSPECLYWWFANTPDHEQVTYTITYRVVSRTTSTDCLRFALDQLPIHPTFLPCLYNRHKEYLCTLTTEYSAEVTLGRIVGALRTKSWESYYHRDHPELSYNCQTLIEDIELSGIDWRKFARRALRYFDFETVDYLIEKELVKKKWYRSFMAVVILTVDVLGMIAYNV